MLCIKPGQPLVTDEDGGCHGASFWCGGRRRYSGNGKPHNAQWKLRRWNVGAEGSLAAAAAFVQQAAAHLTCVCQHADNGITGACWFSSRADGGRWIVPYPASDSTVVSRLIDRHAFPDDYGIGVRHVIFKYSGEEKALCATAALNEPLHLVHPPLSDERF